MEIPKSTAKTINNIEEVAALGILVNVSAIIIAKTAITRIIVPHANKRKSFLPLIPIYDSIIYPIDLL